MLRVEHFSSVLLLPLFFAFIGLRTQIGLLNSSWDWLVCLVIIAVATVGKLGGTSLVSRIMKMSWRESLQLGALMNTRGLMELIVLNIGYDLGILSLRIFTMLGSDGDYHHFDDGAFGHCFWKGTRDGCGVIRVIG